ncbi:MAG TPA: hypothetical protein PKH60_04795, partial [Candidatus Woesebacteria bacterium]|nr:hypothetical protein [Candidatus Woesebacteria bacterium]
MLSAITSFILALGITPLVSWFYQKKRWVDDPKIKKHAKKLHSQPIPRGGGIALYLAIAAPALFFLEIDKYLIAILIGGLILTIIGFIDDIYDIHPMFRLLTNLLVALVVVGSGIGIAYVSNPFGQGVIHLDQPQISFWLFQSQHTIWLLADLFAVLFIIWNMNSINWS